MIQLDPCTTVMEEGRGGSLTPSVNHVSDFGKSLRSERGKSIACDQLVHVAKALDGRHVLELFGYSLIEFSRIGNQAGLEDDDMLRSIFEMNRVESDLIWQCLKR